MIRVSRLATHIVSGQHTNISEPVTQDKRVCLDPEDPKDLQLQLRNQRCRCESNKLLRMRKAVAASPASRMEMPCMYVRTHQPQINYTHTREAEAVRRWHRRRPSVQPTARSWWFQLPTARTGMPSTLHLLVCTSSSSRALVWRGCRGHGGHASQAVPVATGANMTAHSRLSLFQVCMVYMSLRGASDEGASCSLASVHCAISKSQRNQACTE